MSTLTSVYGEMSEIVKHLKFDFPVHVKVHDPVSGKEVEMARDNLLAMLVVDTANLIYDSQWLAAMFMECARCQRAAERASAVAERAFVKWKAEVAADARAKAGGKLTEAAASEQYRTHKDYAEKADLPAYYKTLADLFDDAKRAFELKARMVEVNARIVGGDMRARRAEDRASEATPKPKTTAELAADAEAAVEGAEGTAPPAPPLPPLPPPPSGRTPRSLT